MNTRIIISRITRESISKIPSTIGIYIFSNNKNILYIGKSVNLKARLLSHLENAKQDKKEANIVTGSDKIECVITDSEFKALILEAKLINKIQPKYNVIWRDDKSNIYVKITIKDDFPKLFTVRKENDSRSLYFGPFSSTRVITRILKEIRRIFPYCTQKKISHYPCFYSKIELCDPCPNTIVRKNKEDRLKLKKIYRYHIKQIIRVFKGDTELVLKDQYRNLKVLIKQQKFEEALLMRNRIQHFEYFINQRLFISEKTFEYNQSSKSIIELGDLLKGYFLQFNNLHRIECYDVSNLSHKEATASLVVLIDGLIDKSQYRRFKIKNMQLQSDVDMMREALSRRFKNAWEVPQLIVVDGGKPQVRAVLKLLNKMKINIPLIGIAKHPDRLVIGIKSLPIVKPAANNLGFNLVRSIRDESHRFARKYHLLLREKKMML